MGGEQKREQERKLRKKYGWKLDRRKKKKKKMAVSSPGMTYLPPVTIIKCIDKCGRERVSFGWLWVRFWPLNTIKRQQSKGKVSFGWQWVRFGLSIQSRGSRARGRLVLAGSG